MDSRTWRHATLIVFAALVVLGTTAMANSAPSRTLAGVLTASGDISVNGERALSGATIFPESVIQTGDDSSAVVNLSRLGRIELIRGAGFRLAFDDASITGALESGVAKVSTPAGIAAKIVTGDGIVTVADLTQPAVFTVSVENGNTVVTTSMGIIELRTGNRSQKVGPGLSAVSGDAQVPPATTNKDKKKSKLIALLLLLGLGIAAAFVLAASNNNNNNQFGASGGINPSAT